MTYQSEDSGSSSNTCSSMTSIGQSRNPIVIAWDLFVEFSQKSTIHGINYFGDRKRHWIERAWWMIAFVLSICLCAWLIQTMYARWDRNPIIISFATEPSFVWEVPFPAITICPETKTEVDKFNFTKHYKRNVESAASEERATQVMDTLLQVCNHDLTISYNKHSEANVTNTIITDIQHFAPSLRKTMFFCRFGDIWPKCNESMQTILTEEGQCFTFNMFNSRDLYKPGISEDLYSDLSQNRFPQWTPEGGFDETVVNFAYPYRTYLAGELHEFVSIMRLYQEDVDYTCRSPFQGYRLFLHPPHEAPNFSRHSQNIRIPLGEDVIISVTPVMIRTSEGLRDYNPNRRRCYYNSERSLQFYKFYTQSNCELECLANFTLQYCGCVQFSMPRNSSTPLCAARKVSCYTEAALKANGYNGAGREPITTEGSNNLVANCNCMPACTSISYTTEKFASEFDFIPIFRSFRDSRYNITDQPGTVVPSRLSVAYQKNYFTASHRSELYGRTEFLANCGGILGLFTGVSILSFVEIIYFCTIRICFKMRSRQRKISIVPVDSKDAYAASIHRLRSMKSRQSNKP